jgi:hypothetical protein
MEIIMFDHWFHLLITHRENTAGKIEQKRPHKLYQLEKKNCVFRGKYFL